MVEEATRDGVAYTPARPLSLGLELLAGPLSERGAHAALYQRGMLVFRTLETAIDRERVDRALTEFYKHYAGRKATIAQFRAACEEIAGRNLGWFFDYFIQGTKIPTIQLRRLPSESPGVAAGEIVVRDFPPEGSVRVEMSVRTAQGLVDHSVATRGGVTPFTVNIPAPALGITLDPDLRILRWTEAAERSKAQNAILAALPEPITRQTVAAAIGLYRRALAADPDDASLRGQSLHERLGELEWAHDEWNAALADLDAAINGHSLSPFETYLCRGKAYLYHGVVQLHERRPKEALEDARAGMNLPGVVLSQSLPETPIESKGERTLQQLLDILIQAATHY
jgi:tetratricopeptide (TPR) repeat protein